MDIKKIIAVQSNEAFIDLMYKGDDRAPLKIGWRIEKIAGDPGDMSSLGAQGEVVGSIFHEEIGAAYLVTWDHFLEYPVFVMGFKIKKLK